MGNSIAILGTFFATRRPAHPVCNGVFVGAVPQLLWMLCNCLFCCSSASEVRARADQHVGSAAVERTAAVSASVWPAGASGKQKAWEGDVDKVEFAPSFKVYLPIAVNVLACTKILYKI